MARARELAALNDNDFNAVKFALHSELLGNKPATPPGAPAGPLPDTELRRALDEAHRLVFGNTANGANVDTWMARARELAALNDNDFNAVKFALHSELLGNKPATPPGAPAGPLPDTELRRALDEAHRLVFGNTANGANVDTWMARARELAALNDNDFNAVKFALHSELLGNKPTTTRPGHPLAPCPTRTAPRPGRGPPARLRSQAHRAQRGQLDGPGARAGGSERQRLQRRQVRPPLRAARRIALAARGVAPPRASGREPGLDVG